MTRALAPRRPRRPRSSTRSCALLVQFRRVDTLRRRLLDVRDEVTRDDVVPEMKSAISPYGLDNAEDDLLYAWLGTELGHEMNARVFLCDARVVDVPADCARPRRFADVTFERDPAGDAEDIVVRDQSGRSLGREEQRRPPLGAEPQVTSARER